MSPSQPFDASIPVLTEVIEAEGIFPPAAHDAVAAEVSMEATVAPIAPAPPPVVFEAAPAVALQHSSPPAPAPAVGLHAADADADLERQAIAAWGPEQWEALEKRLSGRILQQLQGRVDFVLEQRIRDSMAEVLQHALGTLTSELRDGLGHTIEQIVARAVSQELTHLRSGR
jgi:hypothetical protein